MAQRVSEFGRLFHKVPPEAPPPQREGAPSQKGVGIEKLADVWIKRVKESMPREGRRKGRS